MNGSLLTLVLGYLRGAAWLYGCVRLADLYVIFLQHNGQLLSEAAFYALAKKARSPKEWFRIIGDDDIYRADISFADMDRCVVHRQYCYAIWDSLFTLERNHEEKPLRLFSKEQFLAYQNPTYIPCTPEICGLAQQLERCSKQVVPLKKILGQALLLARDDCNAVDFLEEMQRLGCLFDSAEKRLQTAQFYKQVYDSVPKPIHNGHSERELQTKLHQPNPLIRYDLWFCAPWEEDRFFRDIHRESAQVKFTGITEHQRFLDRCCQCQTLPTRLFDDCPCGSSLYYTDCCGKR